MINRMLKITDLWNILIHYRKRFNISKLVRFQSLDQGYEGCGVFLDVSKAFEKVWHKSLIHKLEKNGIGGPLLKILQKVILNG